MIIIKTSDGEEYTMKFRAYTLLERAVEAGIDGGYHRAHKYTDTPSEGDLKLQILQYVMNEINEIIVFEAEEDFY